MTVLPPIYLEELGTPARYDRQVFGDHLQPGVAGSGDLAVTAGGAMTVNVAGGACYVRGSQVVNQGLYRCFNDASVSRAIQPAHATLPRIDQIIMRVYDSGENGGAGPDLADIEVVTGTPASLATLDNRNGAVTGLLPANYVRVADLLVPAASLSVSAGNIRDRRPSARGAHLFADGPASGDATTGSASFVSTVKWSYRLECSGVPLRLDLSAHVSHSIAGGIVVLGVAIDSVVSPLLQGTFPCAASGQPYVASFGRTIVPTAGSHLFSMMFATSSGGVATFQDTSTRQIGVTLAEHFAGANNN